MNCDLTDLVDKISELDNSKAKALEQGNHYEYVKFLSECSTLEMLKDIIEDLDSRISALEP